MAGFLTYYCKKCGAAIPHSDILEGLAHVLANENAALCSECVRTPAGGTGDNPTLTAGGAGGAIDQMETREAVPVTTIAPGSGRAPRQTGRVSTTAPAAPPASPRTIMISLIAGGVMMIAAGVILFTHRHSPETKPDVTINSTEPVRTATKTDTSAEPNKPNEAPKEGDAPEFNAMPPDTVQAPNETTLLKLTAEDFKGGKVLNNLWGKGRTARSIYGTKTKDPSMSASFELKVSPEGPATLLVDTIKHAANEACRIVISLNGHEIFQGAGPAGTAADEWTQHRFLVDARILHADRNELRISSLENSAEADGPPYYIISSVEIRAKTP